MNKSLISYNLLSEIKRKQFGLLCENSMNLVERCSKRYQLQSTRSKYIDLLTTFKIHYLIAGSFLQSQLYENDNDIIFSKPNNNKPIDIQNFIPNFDDFMKYLLKAKSTGRTQLDFFTFSVFPSIFNFFIHSPRFDIQLLDELIREISSNDLYLFFEISRVFFVSPEFLSYIHVVFQPIFSHIQDNFDEIKKNKLPEIKRIIRDIFNIEFKNTKFFQSPKFIIRVLTKSIDPYITLKYSFLTPAFHNKETLMFYGLFHYSKPPSDELFKILKIIFDSDFEKDNDEISYKIQERVLNIILKFENHNDSFLKEPFNKPQGLKEYTRCLASNNDIAFFDSVQNHTLVKYHQNTELYICSEEKSKDSECEENYDDDDDENNQYRDDDQDNHLYQRTFETMRDGFETMTPCLRHLLQYTDPIPEITQEMIVKNNLTFEKFLDEILVLRGPIESIPKRRYYAINLKDFLKIKLRSGKEIDDILMPVLDKILIKDPHEIKLCQQYYSQSTLMGKIENRNKKGFYSTRLISSIINPIIKSKKIYFSHSNYIRYPLSLSKEFDSYISKLKPLDIENKNLFILLHLFDQDGFNLYQSYLKRESDKNKPDNYFYSEDFQPTLINLIDNQKIKQFIVSLLNSHGKILIDHLKIAFQELSIFRMIELVDDIFTEILIKYNNHLDSSEIMDVKKIAIILSRPENLNLIQNFCKTYLEQLKPNNNDENDILVLFVNFSSIIQASFEFNQSIIQKIKDSKQ